MVQECCTYNEEDTSNGTVITQILGNWEYKEIGGGVFK